MGVSVCLKGEVGRSIGMIWLALLLLLLSQGNGKGGVEASDYLIGLGSYDITGPAADVNMMGYANMEQIVSGVHFRLRARTFIVAEPQGKRVAFVNLDACMASQIVTIKVLERLKARYGNLYTEQNVAISGIHTHAGPGGYLQYVVYIVTSLGFVRQSFDALVNGIEQSIIQAHENLRPGSIFVNKGELLDASVSRSPSAYLNNPAGERGKYKYNVDKEMTLLKFVDNEWGPVGSFNWFATHGTSMSRTNSLISGDNKGAAARFMEDWFDQKGTEPSNITISKASELPRRISNIIPTVHGKHHELLELAASFQSSPGKPVTRLMSVARRVRSALRLADRPKFVSAFCQSNCGDVSPNVLGTFCIDTGLPCDFNHSTCGGKNELCYGRGPGYPDEFESTRIIGERQFKKAVELFDKATEQVKGKIDFRHTYVDFSNLEVTVTKEGGSTETVKTCPAAMGFAFAAGTTDGPGAFDFKQGDDKGNAFWRLVRNLLKTPGAEQIKCQHPKPILLDTGEMKLPYDWAPSILPVQILRIGQLVILSVPGEFTTMAGRRLRDAVKTVLTSGGTKEFDSNIHVVLAGLTNTYSQYVTTFEEYKIQRYEGASTLYGPHTLSAYIQQFKTCDFCWDGIPSRGASWLREEPIGVIWQRVILVPASGGLIVSFLNAFRATLDQRNWTSSVKSVLGPVLKTIAACVTLGTGNSLGPEGPSVEIGTSVAKGIGALLDKAAHRKLSLKAAGSAAGISSGFNAAVAGCFFAVESVLWPSPAESSLSLTNTTSMVILSAVIASVVSEIGLGSEPAFAVPAYDFRTPTELPLYLLLGIFCGLVSVALSSCTSFMLQIVENIQTTSGMPKSAFPVLGGLLVGLVALAYPEILYWGFENVDILLESRPLVKGLSADLLLQLVAVKIVTTSLCRASGLVGGFYAPSLFIGAATGTAYGKIVSYIIAHADPIFHLSILEVASPQAYGLVGMAATLAGVCQVPLTAVLLLFELTQDYRIVLPLLGAVGLSSWVTSGQTRKGVVKDRKKLQDASAQMMQWQGTSSSNIGLPSLTYSSGAEPSQKESNLCKLESSLCLYESDDEENDVAKKVLVAQAMRTRYVTVLMSTLLMETISLMLDEKQSCAIIVDENNFLIGLLTLSDIQNYSKLPRAEGKCQEGLVVSEVCSSNGNKCRVSCTVTPNTDLLSALTLMEKHGLSQLPVILRHVEDEGIHPVGILDRECINVACRALATREQLS